MLLILTVALASMLFGIGIGITLSKTAARYVITNNIDSIYAKGWREGQQELMNKQQEFIAKIYTKEGIDQLEDWVNDDYEH